MVNNGKEILQLHQKLNGNFSFNQETMTVFVRYLNLLAENIYTRKAEEFLIFLEHCISVDKCTNFNKWGGMKIYQQLIVDKPASIGNKITGFFKSDKEVKRERDYFITITSDGILKSDNHLLESRVKSMIPFTNQLNIKFTVDEEKNITLVVSACAHEQMVINLYHGYVKAINLYVGIRMALQ